MQWRSQIRFGAFDYLSTGCGHLQPEHKGWFTLATAAESEAERALRSGVNGKTES